MSFQGESVKYFLDNLDKLGELVSCFCLLVLSRHRHVLQGLSILTSAQKWVPMMKTAAPGSNNTDVIRVENRVIIYFAVTSSKSVNVILSLFFFVTNFDLS